MGIIVQYRRIAAARLEQLLAVQDEQVLEHLMCEGKRPFPYSLHHFQLGKLFVQIDLFLNPKNMPATILGHVVDGARPVIKADLSSEIIYLNQVRYLAPSEVQAIAQRMAQFTIEDYVERFNLMNGKGDERRIAEEDVSDYTWIVQQFSWLFCFFRIAEDAGDALLRWHT